MVLCGLSAGSLCWFEAGLTAFHSQSCTIRGLGLLPHSNAVHYDTDRDRRPAYQAAVAAGLPAGYAADDGAALHFFGTELADVVASRPGAQAYRVEAVGASAIETPLPARYLGVTDPIAVLA